MAVGEEGSTRHWRGPGNHEKPGKAHPAEADNQQEEQALHARATAGADVDISDPRPVRGEPAKSTVRATHAISGEASKTVTMPESVLRRVPEQKATQKDPAMAMPKTQLAKEDPAPTAAQDPAAQDPAAQGQPPASQQDAPSSKIKDPPASKDKRQAEPAPIWEKKVTKKDQYFLLAGAMALGAAAAAVLLHRMRSTSDAANEGLRYKRMKESDKKHSDHEGFTTDASAWTEDASSEDGKPAKDTKHGAVEKESPGFSSHTALGVYNFQWWTAAKLAANGLRWEVHDKSADISKMNLERCPLPWYAEKVESILKNAGVDVSLFGQGKARSIEALADELSKGESTLMESPNHHEKQNVMRVVNIVYVQIVSPGGQRTLAEVEVRFKDGRKRDTKRLPGMRQGPTENIYEVARRVLHDRLGFPDGAVELQTGPAGVVTRIVDEDSDQGSYPGLSSVKKKTVVSASIKPNRIVELERLGLLGEFVSEETEADGVTDIASRVFCWTKDAEITGVEQGDPEPTRPSPGRLFDPDSWQTMTPWNEEAVSRTLEAHGVDCGGKGPKGRAKKHVRLARELNDGTSHMMIMDGTTLLRVCDLVVVHIEGPSRRSLVETGFPIAGTDETRPTGRFPALPRLLTEDVPATWLRVIMTLLQVPETAVQLMMSHTRRAVTVEESMSYPGLKTMYRKHFLQGRVVARDHAVLERLGLA